MSKGRKQGKGGQGRPGSVLFRSGEGAPPQPLPAIDQRLAMTLRSIGFDAAQRREAPRQAFSLSAPAVQPPPAPRRPSGEGLVAARRDWLLDVMETQRRLSIQASGLMRCRDLPGQAFLDHFYAPGRPVVIEGAIADWPALERWTPGTLKAVVGDAVIEYQGGRTGAADFELAKDRHKRTMPFSAFVDMISAEGADGNDAYITAYNNATNAQALAPLQADLGTVDAYLTPAPGMMWIGPAGTFTPLHFDLTNNLLIQLVGRKRIILVPPTQTRYMYHHRHVFSAIHDLEDEACRRAHPMAAHLTPYQVELAPGEMLYIPIGWWHQVRSLDFSVMLTCTNFLWPNEGYADYPAD